MRWLEAHPEHCHGGNHWLENLTALAWGLQFAGLMLRRCIVVLCAFSRRNPHQVLADGGHEERSASYHLLMLIDLLSLLASLGGQ